MIPDRSQKASHDPPAQGHGNGPPTHFYDLLDVLDLVDELHLCDPLLALEPPD